MAEWITGWMNGGGYLTVGLLMLLENVFPPIPSEVVMPLAGYGALGAGRSLIGVIAAGTLGSVAGALLWYYVGVWVGQARLRSFAARHGRWLTLTPREVDAADAWFDRWGGWAVFIGRMVPGVRTLISVPAGMSGMGLGRFLAFTTLGSLVWTGALALAGWWLGGAHGAVADYIAPVSNLVIAGAVAIYLYRVVTFDRH